MANFRISYFKSFHFNWAFGIKIWLLWKIWIRFFVFVTQFWSERKVLLNFQKMWPWMRVFFLEIEIITRKWLVDKATKKSAWVITSWRLFEIKKSNLRCKKPEACLCLKVNCFASGFLSLHISHSSKCSFVLINFSTDLFFNQGEAPSASKVVSRKKLKSPASIICSFWWMYKRSRRRRRFFKTLICSV